MKGTKCLFLQGMFWELLTLADEGTAFLKNGRNPFPVDTASYPQRPVSPLHVQPSINLQKSSSREAVDGIQTSVNNLVFIGPCIIVIIEE